MPLSKKAIELACSILNQINPQVKTDEIHFCKEDEDFKLNTILALEANGFNSSGNIFIVIENATAEQVALFEKRKDEVPFTSFLVQESGFT